MIIIIPAYQPDYRLVELINEIKNKTSYKILVVNDGSSKDKEEIFNKIKKDVILLKHDKNLGKGKAMKTGLNYVLNKMNKESVIFVDADGQHSVKDIINISNLNDNNSLIIGTRDFNLKHVPFRSKFGNRLTSFFVKNKTNKYIKDTQSGLRLIPFKYIKDIINLDGDRYEYEINVLLYFLYNDINIIEVPIETIYESKKNESSHYKCFKDSLKIYKVINNVEKRFNKY